MAAGRRRSMKGLLLTNCRRVVRPANQGVTRSANQNVGHPGHHPVGRPVGRLMTRHASRPVSSRRLKMPKKIERSDRRTLVCSRRNMP